MTIKQQLIAGIEAESSYTNDPERNFIYVDDIVTIISTLIPEGMVMVSVSSIENINEHSRVYRPDDKGVWRMHNSRDGALSEITELTQAMLANKGDGE